MLKAKKYDWKDSNLALFGSDTEKKVKKDSAQTEAAWKGAGQKVGVQIWRIVKFKVTHWPKDQYGEFYNGDSYIILNTYKKPDSDELLYDVHFWIGKYSTQDEYGTAAYKTVELDTLLDDKPIQHREVQGHESDLFKHYFPTLSLLKGGADTGFRRVLPEQYEPRLFHVKKMGSKQITCVQVSLRKSNLTDEDVFILDAGETIYQWNGKRSSKDEQYKAAQELSRLKSARGGKVRGEIITDTVMLDKYLNDKSKNKKADEKSGEIVLFKVSDEDGSLDMDEVKSGSGISKADFTSDDVFIYNSGTHVFAWIGKGASIDERKNGLSYASSYLNKTETPYLPISVVAEGKEGEAFLTALR